MIRRLKTVVRRLEAKVARLKEGVARLKERVASLTAEAESLRSENKTLRGELSKKERRSKRQAAPFSKDNKKENPRKPGRKSGEGYGQRGQRPPPERVDRVLQAELPEQCPDCGGEVEEEEVQHQYQTDIPPVVPLVTEFCIHVGSCVDCGKRVRGRHGEQTSDAVGAASHQIGPNALVFASHLHSVLGVPYGKVAELLRRGFGLELAPSTLVRAQQRIGSRVEPVYEEIRQAVRSSPVIYPDETGWRIDAASAWLWVFVSKPATIYTIEYSRGRDVIDAIVGLDYAGATGHDGWHSYNALDKALHQTCLAHLLRRCESLLESATRGAVRFPREVKSLLKAALAVRERRDGGFLTPHGLLCLIGKLEAHRDELLEWSPTYEPNRLLRDHIERVGDQLFTFLKHKGIEATNWPSEQAIRPAVANRKVCGGNRSETGAKALARLLSVFRTAHQQRRDAIQFLVEVMRTPSGLPLPPLLLNRP